MVSEWWWIRQDLVGSGRGLILRYYPGIRLEGLRKTTKKWVRLAGRRSRKCNPVPPEYEAGVLTTRPLRSVFCAQTQRKIATCKHGSRNASFSSYGPFEKRSAWRCLWGHVRGTVYPTVVDFVAELNTGQKTDASSSVTRGILQRVRQFLMRRAGRVWNHNTFRMFCNLLSKQ
jgi:hypothetical protein